MEQLNMIMEEQPPVNEDNKKNSNLVQLEEDNLTYTDAIQCVYNFYKDTHKLLVEDNKTYHKVQSLNQALKDLIQMRNLDTPEAEKIKKQESYIKILSMLTTDLIKANKSYIDEEERKADLWMSLLESEIGIGNIYNSILKIYQEELNHIDRIINHKVNNICTLALEIKEVSDGIQKVEGMIKNINVFQNMDSKSQVKLIGLPNITTQLIANDCEVNKVKLASLEQNQTDLTNEINNFYSKFHGAKEKYFYILKAYNYQLERVHRKLIEVQKNLEQVKQIYIVNANTEQTLTELQQYTNQTLQELQEQLNMLENQFKKLSNNCTKSEIVVAEFTFIRLEFKLANVISSPLRYSQRRQLLDNIHAWSSFMGDSDSEGDLE